MPSVDLEKYATTNLKMIPKLLSEEQLLSLHIQEYIALRSEQRTRLDSANKIIHYYAILLGAISAASLAVYKTQGDTFDQVFPYILLLVPLLSIPFAFAQQNEEIIVRNIGTYIIHLKNNISENDIGNFWNWESYHISSMLEDKPKLITSAFRATLLLFFSSFSLILFYIKFGCTPICSCSMTSYFSFNNILLIVDYTLVYTAIRINIGMLEERKKHVDTSKKEESKNIKTDFVKSVWRLICWIFLWKK